MTPADIAAIERALAVTLPDPYKAALGDYPLPRDPETTGMWLSDDPATIVAANLQLRPSIHLPGGVNWPADRLVIGDDGGEEIYVLDASSPPYPVLVFEIETSRFRPYATSFTTFVTMQLDSYQEVERDAKRMDEAYRNKKWWQFWLRPYPRGRAPEE